MPGNMYDSPGSTQRIPPLEVIAAAGVMIDAIRCAKIALDRGLSGPVIGPSSYFMKTPPKQFKDEAAREMTEAFIRGES